MPSRHRRYWMVAALAAFAVAYVPPAQAAVAPPPADLVAQAGLTATNQFRAGLGLPAMGLAPALAASARSHSQYMVKHGLIGHYERAGDAASTGNGPADREAYFGYQDYGGEVVTSGTDVWTAGESVQGWIDTLYHRTPFLDPFIADAGVGSAVSDKQFMSTEDFGRKDWNGSRTRAVLYPADGQSAVPAAWDAVESPNPLRLVAGALDGSGQPLHPTGTVITASFFDGMVQGASITAASLTAADGSAPAFWTFTADNDDHLRETISLIPQAPLQPATRYKVHLAGTYRQGWANLRKPFDLTWSFTTAAAGRIDGTSLDWNGRSWDLTVTGTQLGRVTRLAVGGVPVEFTHQGDTGLKAALGSRWSLVEHAHVEAQWADGSLASWSRYWIAGPEDLVKPSPGQPLPVSGGAATLHTMTAGNLSWAELSAATAGLEGQELGSLHVRKLGAHLLEWLDGSRIIYVDGARTLLPHGALRVGDSAYLPSAWLAETLTGWGIAVGGPMLTDITGHWAESQIRRLVGAGVIAGMGDGSFRPGATLTRAALVKMLAAASKLPLPGGTTAFTDTAGHWVQQQGYLQAAVAAGIVLPDEYPGGRFDPETVISRQEIAVFVVRALGLDAAARTSAVSVTAGTATVAGQRFTDADRWSRQGYVAVAIREGIVTGYARTDGTYAFRPADPASRAEAAVMVVRMLDHK